MQGESCDLDGVSAGQTGERVSIGKATVWYYSLEEWLVLLSSLESSAMANLSNILADMLPLLEVSVPKISITLERDKGNIIVS